MTPAVPCHWASLWPIIPGSQTPATCPERKSWRQRRLSGSPSGSRALGRVCSYALGQLHLCASGSFTDIFVYSARRDAVCIILNLERTLHPLTGVFPAGKKKKRERKKTALHFLHVGVKKIKTPTPCARLSAERFWEMGRPCLRSGHTPRSKVLLDAFLLNTVGSSRDGSFGKKDVLE